MKKISQSDLKKIFKRELQFLLDGISNISNPYHFFSLSTIYNNKTTSRTIVLRNIEKKPLSIYFNADYRSPKVKQLLSNPNCSILFYDNKRKTQLRADCNAIINYNNSISKKIWKSTPLQSRKCYMGNYKPSDLLKEWNPNIPLKYLKKDPEKKDSESGYTNFTVIQLTINDLDILELHHDGHIRFKLDSSKKINFIAP
ncbi:MAG: hypothetical protein CMG66_05820 [Candidatus Marinimicrobia bacterium]|nr:hypothetical protein [Candidatus Neomarinimicrobiota bacterium]|tara:strand:- start:42058 stop:42654 length:597 start_codon:yes stop_codon:yes gene_type:complete